MLRLEQGQTVVREAQGDTVRVAVCGDTCFEMGDASAVADILTDGGQRILQGVQPFLNAAELRIIQWEMALTDADTPIDKCGPNLKAPPACAQFARTGRFEVALLANNHIGDFGPEAVLETREHLAALGIGMVGAGEDRREAALPLSIETAGLRLAIVNIAENEFGLAMPEHAGGNPLDLPANLATIRQAATQHDLVLVMLHGGNEHNPFPSPRMQQTCRAFVDAGAHAVVCIHAHCPQGIEIHQGAPIVYCTGNFFFPKSGYDPKSFWWTGFLPKITFDRRGATALELLPYHFCPDPWRIEPLSPNQDQAFRRYLAGLSTGLDHPAKMQRRFNAWACKYGLRILQGIGAGDLPWPADLADRAQVREILGLRNLLTCEAHHEVLATAMRLVETYGVAQAEQDFTEIETLQSAAFLFDQC